MRLTLIKFLLPILLLLAQQAAIAHEFSHLSDRVGGVHGLHKKVPGENACEDCAAFAQISGALTSEAPPPLPDSFSHESLPPLQVARLTAGGLSPRSRGPPAIL